LSIGVERVDYIRVPVKDIEEAKHFYGELLGLPLDPNSPHDDWVEYTAGNVTLAVMTPHTHEAEGVQVNEMWDSGVCRGAGIKDPSGNPILLHRRYAPYPDGSTP
jgi:catechol 2,3-dioxygenase-like lactoylglutathione lyase family enzyme